MESKWSLGVLIGLPVTVVLVLICLGVLALAVMEWRSGNAYNDSGIFAAFGVGGLVIVLGVALSPFGFYPYEAQYHRWEPVSGTVSEISKRIVSSGDGMSEKFVVRFEGSQQEYGCEDTRCAVVDEGDELAMSCIRVWQYAGIDGYDCRFVNNGGESA